MVIIETGHIKLYFTRKKWQFGYKVYVDFTLTQDSEYVTTMFVGFLSGGNKYFHQNLACPFNTFSI